MLSLACKRASDGVLETVNTMSKSADKMRVNPPKNWVVSCDDRCLVIAVGTVLATWRSLRQYSAPVAAQDTEPLKDVQSGIHLCIRRHSALASPRRDHRERRERASKRAVCKEMNHYSPTPTPSDLPSAFSETPKWNEPWKVSKRCCAVCSVLWAPCKPSVAPPERNPARCTLALVRNPLLLLADPEPEPSSRPSTQPHPSTVLSVRLPLRPLRPTIPRSFFPSFCGTYTP